MPETEHFSPVNIERAPKGSARGDEKTKQELERFNDKYHHAPDEDGYAEQAARAARRRRLLKQRIREEKLKALLPQPWKFANPGPIGLLGFSTATILLNLHNTGRFPLYSVVPSMGICCGGGAQIIAGLFEYVRGNTFGCVAFTIYGAFWLSLVGLWMLPNASNGGPAAVLPAAPFFAGVYLIIWGLFSTLMMCCAIRMNVIIFVIFFCAMLLFFLLGGGMMAGNLQAIAAGGYVGVICGCLALYLAFAEIINEVWDRAILPVFPMTQVLGWFGYGTAGGDGHAKSAGKH